MAMAVRMSRIHPKSMVFFQMQVINPNSFDFIYWEIYFYKAFGGKMNGITLGSAWIIFENQAIFNCTAY